MRRSQAILVVLMLAALPLVMLAQTSEEPACGGMCCVRHAQHSSGLASSAQSEVMSCQRGAAQHLLNCCVKSKHRNPEIGLLAPIPPTLLSPLAQLLPPPVSRPTLARLAQYPISRSLPDVFEPPRSRSF
jgi:hypothetical protein